VLLWPDGAPHQEGKEPYDVPALTIHYPENPNGSAIVVNPGGGYRILASDHEGLQIARYLNRQGVTAFVLRYRVGPKYDSEISLLDAQRAVRYVRAHADEFGLSADRIGMLGSSAGGHLTSAAGTRFDIGEAKSGDPIERESSRPDFIVLMYPAINGELFGDRGKQYTPTHKLVTNETPPTFLMQTHEDNVVVSTHSIQFYQALLENNVPAEMHVYNFGGHGLGLGPGDPELRTWPDLMSNWLRRSGFYTAKNRIKVTGTITLDGKPVKQGWVTFIPDDSNSPTAAATIGGAEGRYTIKKKHGPTIGKHQVELRVQSYKGFGKTGEYSLDDVETYRSLKPGDSGPIIMDLKAGDAINLDIRSK
jgi:acetyl esterase/lipase